MIPSWINTLHLYLLKLFAKLLGWLIGAVLLYLAVAVAGSLIPTNPTKVAGPQVQRIWVASNGVHTDFIIAAEAVPASIRSQLGYLADYRYLAFGWGDKGFYLDTPTWSQLKVSTAIRAMLLPSPTAVHVTGYTTVGDEWAGVDVSQAQVDTLLDYINGTFRLNEGGQLMHIDDAGYGDDDEFYEAIGSYNAIYTCNNWVNQGLKRMGIRTALWSPSEWGIMRWLR